MFRIIFGLTLSIICGLFICVAFISFAADDINQSQLGGMILGSLVLNGVPGWLLCYSGGQSLKSKKVLRASLKMLRDNNSIDIEKISSLTGRNKSKTIKDIKRGQEKGIIPNDIEIIVSSKIVEDKWLKKGYVKIQKVQEQALESEKAQYQTIIGCSLIFSGLITLLLKILPGNSLWWGITLLIIGIVMLFVMESWRLD